MGSLPTRSNRLHIEAKTGNILADFMRRFVFQDMNGHCASCR
jgi:hypothetical protein